MSVSCRNRHLEQAFCPSRMHPHCAYSSVYGDGSSCSVITGSSSSFLGRESLSHCMAWSSLMLDDTIANAAWEALGLIGATIPWDLNSPTFSLGGLGDVAVRAVAVLVCWFFFIAFVRLKMDVPRIRAFGVAPDFDRDVSLFTKGVITIFLRELCDDCIYLVSTQTK